MNFQVGDLIITKDNRNHRVSAYVVKVHEPDYDFYVESVTIQYSQDHWIRLPITTVKDKLNQPFKPARWYHYPVKT